MVWQNRWVIYQAISLHITSNFIMTNHNVWKCHMSKTFVTVKQVEKNIYDYLCSLPNSVSLQEREKYIAQF